MNKHLNIIVQGRVQGVWFRDSARTEARQLGIKGFVRNEPNGSVYIEAEGKPQKLNQFVKWCHCGPELAVVKNVDVRQGELKNYNEFIISY